ncbi:hypothetical protein RMATCC62417_05392 [Rhizopus microsporus]|nr:hypothetical protein RMATCC62417_05392 [Rhizopus microsporus]
MTLKIPFLHARGECIFLWSLEICDNKLYAFQKEESSSASTRRKKRKGKDASKKVTAKRAAQLLRTGKPDEAPVPIFASHMELKDIQLKETSTAQITT